MFLVLCVKEQVVKDCSGHWLARTQILDSGMFDPQVLEMVGYDPGEYGGFAFLEWVLKEFTMLRYGINEYWTFL